MNRVVIYGGTGGIGMATARALRKRGIPLHLAARDAGRLEEVAADLGETTFTAGDVTDPAHFAIVTQEAGDTLAGLVYAVGTINLKPLAKLTADDAVMDFKLNALGALLALQAAAPALKAG
ncbi:SDR family NAD(P)-dependent oxidoreductase, partial [Methylobacterium sp. WL19]